MLALLLLHLRDCAFLSSLHTFTTSNLALLDVPLALSQIPQLLNHVLVLLTIVVPEEHGELGFQKAGIRKIVEGLHAAG